jgi:adenylate cyclase
MAGEKILVVDDGKENREFLIEYILKPAGYTVFEGRDGMEGLAKARDEQPDLMLLDLQMPKMDGIAVLEAMRLQALEIPVILMTFYGSEEVAVDVFRLGVKDYIKKPYTADEMLGAINRVLAETQLLRERQRLTTSLIDRNRDLHTKVKELTHVNPGGMPVLGRRTDVTVLQAGFRDLGVMNNMDEIQFLDLLNRQLHLAADVIARKNGTLSHISSEGFMAIFNAPDDLEEHTRYAVEAAYAVQSAVLEAHPGGGVPRFGIGIDCGSAVVGGLTASSHSSYSAIGESVVMARRLMEAALPGGVLFSRAVAEKLIGHMQVSKLGEIPIKGRTEPFGVFSVATRPANNQGRSG